jgi:hypothetical protein
MAIYTNLPRDADPSIFQNSQIFDQIVVGFSQLSWFIFEFARNSNKGLKFVKSIHLIKSLINQMGGGGTESLILVGN